MLWCNGRLCRCIEHMCYQSAKPLCEANDAGNGRETKRTVQSSVVHRRVDNDSVVTQPQAIAKNHHAQGGCDLRRAV